MTLMAGCDGWKIKAVDPPMRWDSRLPHEPEPIKTSHPVLFISNTLDPVTPLYAGIKMAKKFKGAGLVEQESEGHCSLAMVSKCTTDVVVKYLSSGEVPDFDPKNEEGRVKCKADEWPFHPFQGAQFVAQNGMDAQVDAERLQALGDARDVLMMTDHFGNLRFQAGISQLAKLSLKLDLAM